MKCPICEVSLQISDRSGVEIDYCPECRGVWLDRGELDKMVSRAAAMATVPPPSQETRPRDRYDDKRDSAGSRDHKAYAITKHTRTRRKNVVAGSANYSSFKTVLSCKISKVVADD